MTTFMRDIKTDRMEAIEADLLKQINKIFPPDRYEVRMTGKSLLYLKGTHYLIRESDHFFVPCHFVDRNFYGLSV